MSYPLRPVGAVDHDVAPVQRIERHSREDERHEADERRRRKREQALKPAAEADALPGDAPQPAPSIPPAAANDRNEPDGPHVDVLA